MNARIISILFLFPIINGCDTIYGVTRHASLGEIEPPIECIVRATEAVDGVENVTYRNEQGGRELTLTGIQNPEVISRVMYGYGGLYGNFYFRTNYQGIVDFNHTYIDINRRPFQSEIDKMRPLMVKIERSISRRCHLDIENKTEESCMGVSCGGV